MGVHEYPPHHHCPVCKEGGAETALAGGGGDEGENGDGLPGLQQAYGRQLELRTSFKYLEQILTDSDENWLAVVGNLWKARKSWARL